MIRIGILLFLFLSPNLFAQVFPRTSSPFCTASTQVGKQGCERIFADYANLYNPHNAKNFGVAMLGGALLANTEMDHHFQDWYRDNIRSGCTNELAKISKQFGEGHILIPAMAASAVTYRFWQTWREVPDGLCTFGEWTDRSTRGYLVGAPTLLMFQSVTGGGRPRSGVSHWKPFRNHNGISGHAYLGAVPFITAAHMTEKPAAKGLFYALSTFCAWSRVNDDAHYLSQVALGWYLAYLSVRAVSETEGSRLPKGLTIFPVSIEDSVGIGLRYQY